MIASNQQNKIDFDVKGKRVIITTQKVLNIQENPEEIRKIYRDRLRAIIEQVKALKNEAEEIKEKLALIKEIDEAKSISPAPEPSQSSPPGRYNGGGGDGGTKNAKRG